MIVSDFCLSCGEPLEKVRTCVACLDGPFCDECLDDHASLGCNNKVLGSNDPGDEMDGAA